MMGEPRFFSIRSSAAWRRGTTGHLSVEDDGLSIVRKQVYRPLRRDKADFPHIVWPIADAAVGRGGGWLLLDAAAGVWKADLRTGHIEALLLPGHEWFTRSASIAVTGDNWAAADPGASPTLVMLSLDNAQVLWARSEWNGKPISVLAVASEAEDRTVALAAIRDGVHEEEFRLLRIGNSGEAVGELPIVLPLDAAVGNSVDGTDSDAAGDAAAMLWRTMLQRRTLRPTRLVSTSTRTTATRPAAALPAAARPTKLQASKRGASS